MDTVQNVDSGAEGVADGTATNDTPTTEAAQLFTQELPPVTEQSNDYIDEVAELEATAESDPANNDLSGDDSATGPESARGTLDKKGGAFDPAIHRYPPELTPGGKWRKRPKSEIDSGPTNEKTGEKIEGNHRTRLEAQKVAGLYSALHITVFGQDGLATPEQQGMLVDGFENYFHHNGTVEIPPGLDLALICGTYSTQIAARPKNSEKVKGFFKGVAEWWKKRKEKKGK